jgi:hypothetical protein
MGTTAGASVDLRLGQIAVIVADARLTMEAYRQRLGWGPWTMIDLAPPLFEHLEVGGESREFGTRLALADIDGLMFEVCQPHWGEGPHRLHLDEHGPGIHHLRVSRHDADGAEIWPGEPSDEYGFPVVASGRVMQDTQRWAYLDGRRSVGTVLEVIRGTVDIEAIPHERWPAAESAAPRERARIRKVTTVVSDLDAAVDGYVAELGLDGWQQADEAQERALSQAVGPVRAAYGSLGEIEVELCQPLTGAGLYGEFLTTNGPGVHHFAVSLADVATPDDVRARLPFATVVEGETPRGRFVQLDARAELGTVVEAIVD